MIETADRRRPRLCGGRPCAVRRLVQARLRQAGAPLAGRDDRRRARGSGALQEERRWISCCGSRRTRSCRAGKSRGAAAGPAGISNARRWRESIWARPSTFMAAASIWCFPITKTKSPRAKARITAIRWRKSGCTTASCRSKARRCRRALGNFVTIRELLADWPGEVLRFNMLRTHYRQPMDWTFAGLRESWKTLERWYAVTEPLANPAPDAEFFDALSRRSQYARGDRRPCIRPNEMALAGGLGFLGFSNVQLQDRGQGRRSMTVAIADAIAARNAARKAKNFAESDRIRDELLAKGIVLKDGPRRHDLGGEAMSSRTPLSFSTPRCATARRRRAWISRSRTSARSRWRSTSSAWITSKAAGRAPIRPTRRSSPNARR